ncbi:TRAP transporter large permease subunit [Desulfomonile tiedjei]|uniref:TRAP transporter, DctM subunit n=1 Tax=Desulfomonile tiedjei (strain ATCC 49306 / DSM 6799 / DCB-1) TaxID=706587 RepID=I4CDV0_DESTA|nr:TRAP transporter large permease subunit [Desulfomonile tiedjei]AFM27741.1 TRAP transporter, DctM subunit [Desulfomonile tiedjei DSM 6799]
MEMDTCVNIVDETVVPIEAPRGSCSVSAALAGVGQGMMRVLKPVSLWSGRLAAAMIMIMAFAMVLDVLLRKYFSTTIPQVMEFEQWLMASVVFFSIAHTQIRGGHVSVDMLSSKFSERTRILTESFGLCIGAALFAIVAVEHVTKIQHAIAMHEIGIVLQWPLWPFYAIVVLGSILICLVFTAQLLTYWARLWEVSRNPILAMAMLLAAVGAVVFLPAILKALSIQMTVLKAGIAGILLLFSLMAIGSPIAFVMGFIGILGSWYLRDAAASFSIVQMAVFPTVGDYIFTVIPFFVGMGFLCFASDFSRNLFDAAYKCFGNIRGGLAISTIMGCGGFAAICGDSMATGATMGSVAIPEMKKAKYDMSMACGAVAAGGTLGILIPPSIGFIVYGIITEQSIGKLFIAGIAPGLLLTLMYCTVVYVRCRMDPLAGPAGGHTTAKEKFEAITGIWPVLILFFLIMGGIWFGLFTANEGGAVGFVAALAFGMILRRFTFKKFLDAMMETIEVTAMIFTILLGVTILNYFVGMSELPLAMADWVKNLGIHRAFVFMIILGIYVILGMLMNIIPMVMLTLPMIFPTVIGLGYDPIWFGVIMVIMMEMGQITPPVGVNVYVIAGVAKDVPMATVFRGIVPFIAMQCVLILILYMFPIVATYLPSSMDVLEAIKDL